MSAPMNPLPVRCCSRRSEREPGQGLVEYGMIIALISLALIAFVADAGLALQSVYETMGNMLSP